MLFFTHICITKTNEEFRNRMNGYKMNLQSKTDQVDHRTFVAPRNIVLPDSVGKKELEYNEYILNFN